MMYNLHEMLSLTDLPTTEPARRAIVIGLVAPLIVQQCGLVSQPLGWHIARLSRAVALGQIAVFFDGFGRMCGYAHWTRPSAATVEVMLRNGPEAVGASDLGMEGDPWMLSMVVMYGLLGEVLAALRDGPLHDAQSIGYFRRRNGRRLAVRSTGSSFFRRRSGATRPATEFLRTIAGHSCLTVATQALSRAAALGNCLQVASTVRSLAGLSMAEGMARFEAPIALGQYRIYRAPAEEPTGLLTWAWINQSETPPLAAIRVLAPLMWNEGGDLCVTDAIASPACASTVGADLAHDLFPGERLWMWASEDTTPDAPTLLSCEPRARLANRLGGIAGPVRVAEMLTGGSALA